MISQTLTQLLASIRAGRGTVETPTTLIPDAELTDWVNKEIRALWSALAPLSRDEFTTLSANQTVTPGATACTFDLSTLTGFMQLRGIDRDSSGNGTVWTKIRPWRFGNRTYFPSISYHVAGKTVRFEPFALSAGTYRFWYLSAPTNLVAGVDAYDFPLGGDEYVVQGCIARLRARMEEDPGPHLAIKAEAFKMAREYIVQHNAGDQEAITGSHDAYWDW